MNIGFILFPNLTQLDLTGPLQVLHRIPGATTHVLAKTLAPVPSDCGLSLVPTGTFSNAPALDLLCVPGGFGVSRAMADQELLDYVETAGAQVSYVTSVCTGAFILGMAGLLRGKNATTHWAYHELLVKVGATPTQGRVVRDGHVITGGGVTAGIDFAFTVVREMVGEATAQGIQVALEYRPDPPAYPGHHDEAIQPVLRSSAQRTVEFSRELDACLARSPR